MSFFEGVFIDVENLPSTTGGFIQLVYLTSTYVCILMYAANMISEGSELLLLVPCYADLVGSLVLPILGSLPDALIVLFSGLGPDAQHQLDVGIGAMVGSVVLLTTVAWFVSILCGRVSIDARSGILAYKSAHKLIKSDFYNLKSSGVHVDPKVNKASWIMLITCVPYLLMQCPGIFISGSMKSVAAAESNWALAALASCILLLALYISYQFYSVEEQEDYRNTIIVEAIRSGEVSLLGVMKAELSDLIAHHNQHLRPSSSSSTSNINKINSSNCLGSGVIGYQTLQRDTTTAAIEVAPTVAGSAIVAASAEEGDANRESSELLSPSEQEDVKNKLKRVLLPFFHKYDISRTNVLDMVELSATMRDLGETLDQERLKTTFARFDASKSGGISFDEFVDGIIFYLRSNAHLMRDVQAQNVDDLPATISSRDRSRSRSGSRSRSSSIVNGIEVVGYVQEEFEDVPEDLQYLSPEQQQHHITMRAFRMMTIGTLLLIVFSEPLVGALSEVGDRSGAGAFIIAFIFAPLIGNAPELLATVKYATKKTTASITVAHSTLLGSVIVSNTFALSVFMAIIYFKSLVWQYLAETLTLLVIQSIMAFMCMKSVHTLLDGCFIVSLYPLSLILVFTLQMIGWD